MEQHISKAELITALRASRAEFESIISQVSPKRMTEQGVCGSWSVKDLLAHIAVGNDWLALQLERRTRGEVPGYEELQRDHELGLDNNETRNTYFALQHRNLDLAYVCDWDRRANERMLTALAELPETMLKEPDWWTNSRSLGNAFDTNHDREHAHDIQRWLEQS